MVTRQDVKNLEGMFLKATAQYQERITSQPHKFFIESIKKCENLEKMQTMIPYFQEIDKEIYRKLTYTSEQVQECIRLQFNRIGIDGYALCFTKFHKFMEWDKGQKNIFA